MSILIRMAEEVLTLPYWIKADPERSALLILPGIQEYRIPEGARHWPDEAKHLWVAGTRADPFYTRREIVDIIREVTTIEGDTSLIENGGWENHTPDQMRWAIELLKKNREVNHLIVCTAAYHIPRTVLTFIKMMLKHEEMTVISSLPLWNPDGPARDDQDWQTEISKIGIYQKEGDVASDTEWKEYLDWRASQ